MQNIENVLAKRNNVIREVATENPNYFDIKNYLELDKYSTYIFITPRSIGKTYSQWQLVFEVYELNGEYSVWMRTSGEEVKEILKDYKHNRPEAWRDYAVLKGNQLIDKRNGNLIVKFVSVSTLGNLASITGDGCFGIIYDEFLKRGARKSQAGIYSALTDFIRTVERGHLLTIICSANFTTLDSELLEKWDLWDDEKEVDRLDQRLRYRLIQEWDNPPVLNEISTASIWSANDEKLKAFMERAEVLDNSKSLVYPESRLELVRNIECYTLNQQSYTLSVDNDNTYIIREGVHMKGGVVYDLTTEDGFYSDNGHVRPYRLSTVMNKVIFSLENGNLLFTTHRAKENFLKYIISLTGKLQERK